MDWTADLDHFQSNAAKWRHAGSNILLDFHGDPVRARLVVFSDGNHNMALKEAVAHFIAETPEVRHVFYTTTPPGPLLSILKGAPLQIGNLLLSVRPHVFLAPPEVLDRLVSEGEMSRHVPFVRNQGNVLLVRKGNPENISGIADLAENRQRLFISNPETEKASFGAYYKTLINLLPQPGAVDNIRFCRGICIHHREAPEAVKAGRADAAIIFYHLALHYTRLFPDEFEIIPLGGTPEFPDPAPGNVIGRTHAGLIGGGGSFGSRFLEFLCSPETAAIYQKHGLLPINGGDGSGHETAVDA